MNNNQNGSNGAPDALDIQVAKLAFLGASITTLGDVISAIAAGLALEGLLRSGNQSAQNQNKQLRQLEATQKQLDSLLAELKHFNQIMK